MKIGIVGAMAQEVEILSQLMTDKKETKVASAVIFEGKINGKEVALLQSGIGKVAAAIGTTALLQFAKPDVVLNTGSAGGVAKGLKVGDIVISDETRYHDADVTAFGYEKGQLPANPAAFLSDKQLADLADEIAQSQGRKFVMPLTYLLWSFVLFLMQAMAKQVCHLKSFYPWLQSSLRR